MIKKCICISLFFVSLLVVLLIFQYDYQLQLELPFNTTDSFELSIYSEEAEKQELIVVLNDLTDKYDGLLVKIVPGREDYEKEKDVIWFGMNEPIISNPAVAEQNIEWLKPGLYGAMIHSTDMGNRPLYGTYNMKGSEEFKQALTMWAETNGISISWYQKTPTIKVISGFLLYAGTGSALVTAVLLNFATIIVWFAAHSKMRAIRLLNGIDKKRMHLEDAVYIARVSAPAVFVAFATFLVYTAVIGRIGSASIFLLADIIAAITLVFVAGVYSYIISVIVKPTVSHIANREIPLKSFGFLGRFVECISIFLALLIVPATLTAATALYQLSADYALWEPMSNTVRISLNDVDSLSDEKVASLLKIMEENNNLCMSFVVDKAILLTNEELSGFDHIIIVNKTWVDTFGIGIETDAEGGKLTRISFNDLSDPMQDFLNAQMPVLTKDGTTQPAGVDFYRFDGKTFLALPPNVGSGGSTIQAKNPLVILANDPVASFGIRPFLIPLLSSGNIVFLDEDILRREINDPAIAEKISSIDAIADAALEQAQKFKEEAAYYVFACTLVLIAAVVAVSMSAQLWTGNNKKRIFTLHTAGKKYIEIMKQPLKHEIMIIISIILIGSIVSYVLKHPEAYVLLIVLGCLMPICVITEYVAYQICIKRIFTQVSYRKE